MYSTQSKCYDFRQMFHVQCISWMRLLSVAIVILMHSCASDIKEAFEGIDLGPHVQNGVRIHKTRQDRHNDAILARHEF